MYFLPGDRYLGPISMKFCMMVELCPGRGVLHFAGEFFSGPQMGDQKWFFGQFAFGISSSVCVINKTH